MEVSKENRMIVEMVGEAMQAGSSGEDSMLSLFAEDGELVEPFGGAMQSHVGHDAIRSRYREMVSAPRPPGFILKTNKVWLDNESVLANWTCNADGFSTPMVGQDRYRLEDGKIKRLEISVLQFPT